jgi:DNA-binding LacI/PurR family transcriptional regulator
VAHAVSAIDCQTRLGLTPGRQVTPPLTTVAILQHDLGVHAARMLLALLSGEDVTRVRLPTRLVVRGSTRERR